MEDVLGVYTRPYDPRRPQVCLDETSRQLLAEVSPPRPVEPGRPAMQDYGYQRHGVCNLFLVCEPLRGWRNVMVSDRRTRIDWAYCVKDLLDVHYPDAEQIVLVQDNLNTHTPASLYEAFEPAEARRLATGWSSPRTLQGRSVPPSLIARSGTPVAARRLRAAFPGPGTPPLSRRDRQVTCGLPERKAPGCCSRALRQRSAHTSPRTSPPITD
jgi:hypothetical protein